MKLFHVQSILIVYNKSNMGYDTKFTGNFILNEYLDLETKALIDGLSSTRRLAIDTSKLPTKDSNLYGVEGEFYFIYNLFNSDREILLHDLNTPPSTQPGLWCQWIYDEETKSIMFDVDSEKFYNYVEWITYLIKSVFAPKKYILNGKVEYFGGDIHDRGYIEIINNIVSVHEYS